MKHSLAGWSLLVASAVQAQTPATPADAAAQNEQISRLFGLTFGEQLHRAGITDEIVMEALTQGMREGLQGRKTTPAEQAQVNQFIRSAVDAATARNRAAAKDFLSRNGREKGVKTTASGLEYRVLVPGNLKAPAVASSDELTVNYRGKLLDGAEFDSTYARGAPATFRLNGVIAGWQEGLALMKPGAKWQLFVPPELGYDASPRPGIPAGSLLIFEVDLLKVSPAPSQPLAPPGQ